MLEYDPSVQNELAGGQIENLFTFDGGIEPEIKVLQRP